MFVLFLFLAIVGYYSWTRLAIDAYPDIADTTVQVVTQVPGLAAEEIEQQISIPIERAMNGLPGLNVMRSKNTFGLSTVVLVFDDGIEDYWGRNICGICATHTHRSKCFMSRCIQESNFLSVNLDQV